MSDCSPQIRLLTENDHQFSLATLSGAYSCATTPGRLKQAHQAPCSGTNFRLTPFMQKRRFVGAGPSLNTWPRWPWQRWQRTCWGKVGARGVAQPAGPVMPRASDTAGYNQAAAAATHE